LSVSQIYVIFISLHTADQADFVS